MFLYIGCITISGDRAEGVSPARGKTITISTNTQNYYYLKINMRL